MRMMRCKGELDIKATANGATLSLWPGVDVDFDRELAPGFTIAAAVAGREDLFEPVAAAPSAASAVEHHAEE